MPNLDSVGRLPARATDDRSGIIPACAGLGARASHPHAWGRGRPARMPGYAGVAPVCLGARAGFALPGRGRMVFEYIIRHSPRRRALHSIAEGFSPTAGAVERNKCSIVISPTARGAYRMIAFLAKFEPNWTGLNIPRVAPHAMTEIHFGLLSAGSDRLARHGRPRQGSMYLRTAVNSQSPSALGRLQVGMFP